MAMHIPKMAAMSTSPPMTELVVASQAAADGAEAEAAVAAQAAEDGARAVSEPAGSVDAVTEGFASAGSVDAVSEAMTSGLDGLFVVVEQVQEDLVVFGQVQEGGSTSSEAQPAHPAAHPWPAPYTPRSPQHTPRSGGLWQE